MKEIDLFIEGCFSENHRDFFEKHFKFDKNFFLNWGTDFVIRLGWNLRNYCSYSGIKLTKETIRVYKTYWYPFSYTAVHKDYYELAKNVDVIECQKLDSSCNDCFFMKRIDQKNGFCNKFEKNVKTLANQIMFENAKCFIHRKEYIAR